MTVSNDDILAMCRETLNDVEGAQLAVDMLDEREARELVGQLIGLLAGLCVQQEAERLQVDNALGATLDREDQYAILWNAINGEMHLGFTGFKRLMGEIEEFRQRE